jgi:hypothetical protein
MYIATPAAQSSVDHSSTSTLSHSSSDAVISEDAVPSIGKASNGSSLVHSILQAYSKEILEYASDQFLDLAVAIRLKTIGARELVGLLAEAEADIIDDEDYDDQVKAAWESPRSSLDAIRTSKPPATIDVQCRPVSTAPSQSSSLGRTTSPKMHEHSPPRRRRVSLDEPICQHSRCPWIRCTRERTQLRRPEYTRSYFDAG